MADAAVYVDIEAVIHAGDEVRRRSRPEFEMEIEIAPPEIGDPVGNEVVARLCRLFDRVPVMIGEEMSSVAQELVCGAADARAADVAELDGSGTRWPL